MVGWHHRLNGREFEQALGNSEGQGGLACCSSWGRKESDKTERLNDNKRELDPSGGSFLGGCLEIAGDRFRFLSSDHQGRCSWGLSRGPSSESPVTGLGQLSPPLEAASQNVDQEEGSPASSSRLGSSAPSCPQIFWGALPLLGMGRLPGWGQGRALVP